MVIILGLLIIILGLGWHHFRRKPKLVPYLLEYFLKINDPVPLCGKPDVVWINSKGRLIVGDYKSRKRPKVYDSEIIQLSVYRLLLEQTQDKRVADYGYIHFKTKSVKVKLLSKTEVVRLYYRYWLIMDGKTAPREVSGTRYCQYCSHASQCS